MTKNGALMTKNGAGMTEKCCGDEIEKAVMMNFLRHSKQKHVAVSS